MDRVLSAYEFSIEVAARALGKQPKRHDPKKVNSFLFCLPSLSIPQPTNFPHLRFPTCRPR